MTEKPHAGMADQHRPVGAGLIQHDSSLYHDGRSNISLLFPIPPGSLGVGPGVAQDSPQLATLVNGRAANNGAGGTEEIQVNGDGICWTRDDAGLILPFSTGFFRLKNNTNFVSDWLPITMRGVRTNPISPNGAASMEAIAEVVARQPVYCIKFTSVVIQTQAAAIVQALIFLGSAAIL